ncbi:MAG: deoxynucleoside kinase [Chloroflexota bacterium]
MGKLVTVVGNSGVGKTTLVDALGRHAPFVTGLEQHGERPFQRLFAQEFGRYALPNQIDYLLLRAEQEWTIRQSPGVGLQDGGLDMDFHIFTRLFWQKGYLSSDEYDLCRRLYQLIRQLLRPPDLIIRLVAPLPVVAERYGRRGRPVQIATTADLAALEELLNDWLDSVTESPVVNVDASLDDPTYANDVPRLLLAMQALQ